MKAWTVDNSLKHRKYMFGRSSFISCSLSLFAAVPVAVLAQEQSAVRDVPVSSDTDAAAPVATPPVLSSSPGADEEFSLDLDEQMEMGLAWPDMDGEESAQDMPALPPLPETDAQNAVEELADTPADDTSDNAKDELAESGRKETSDAQEEPALVDDGSKQRYQIEINGLGEADSSLFRERFKALSLLEEGRGKSANIAQINRRMRLDADLIDRILRASGYYDVRIRQSVQQPEGADGGKLRVTFSIRPGVRYTVSRVSLPGIAHATDRVPSVRTAFMVEVGDPVDADAIMAARQNLAIALGENGFPFAKVEEPLIVVDHEIQKGDLEVVVRAGGFRKFGDIVLNAESAKVFSAKHLGRIARFDKDDVYQASDVEDLRRAIVATGLVSSASVEPQESGDGEHSDIAVSLSPAPMRTISGEVGYGTGEGYRVEASWQHRNFFPPEGALTATGLLGTKEQAAGVTYRRNNFMRRDNILSANLSARHQDYDAYEAKTLSFSANIERQSNILYQKKWAWSAGVEVLGSRERDFFNGALVESNRDYLIAAVPLSVTYDASDDLLDPKTGFRLGGHLSPEVAWQDGVYTYARAQIDGSVYMPVGDRVVLASRVRLGSILGGVDVDRIAPTRRFYAGGGASVRGYAYQSIGPRDLNNDSIGGKSLMEFSLEARVRFGTFGVVPFVDAGNISTGLLPRLNDVRYGAGLGLRYYSTFGPIRIDVGTPLNRQPGDSRIGVYVSLGQAF